MSAQTHINPKGRLFLHEQYIQDMKYRQSLMAIANKYGGSRASGKNNKARSYICFRLRRYDGGIESLACRSRRPLSHPNQHHPEEIKLLRDMCRRNPQPGRVELRPSRSCIYRIPPNQYLIPNE